MTDWVARLRQTAANIQQLLAQYAEIARREVEPNRHLYNPFIIDAASREILSAIDSVRKLDILASSEFGGKTDRPHREDIATALGFATLRDFEVPPHVEATSIPMRNDPAPPPDPLIPQEPYTVGKSPLRNLPYWDASTFDPGPPETRFKPPAYKPRHQREED